MKFLFLTLLLLISCTNNKQSSHSIEPVEVVEPELLVASYDNGLDLILVQNFYCSWYTSSIWYEVYLQNEITNTSTTEQNTDDDDYPDYCPELSPNQYTAVYWNSNDNSYYTVKGIQETNNLEYTIDTNLQQEPLLSPILQEYYTNDINTREEDKLPLHKLLYVGSLTPLKRVYINEYDTN